MRKQLWSAFVSGWAISLLCAGVTQAQIPAGGGGGHYEAAMSGGEPNGYPQVAPTQYQQPGGAIPPAFQQYPSGPDNYQAQLQMPPLNPYPATSPYDHAFDQHFNEDGLWYRRTKDGAQAYYSYLDFWGANLKAPDPGTQIGEGVFGQNTAWEAANSLVFRIVENSRDATGRNTVVTTVFEDLEGRNFNAPVTLSTLNPDMRRLGLRMGFGVLNPDNTGAEVLGFWIVPREQGRAFPRASIERAPDPSITPSTSSILPEFEGVSVPNSGRLTFDEGFQVDYTSSAWGAEVNLFGITPINKEETMFIRGIFGIRYYGTDNQMNLYGQNSDLIGSITISHPEEDVVELVPFFNPNYNFSPRHNFILRSQVSSHLVGPQIGLQPEIGGKNFKITGWGKFAPMANIETATVSTENYGLPFTDGPKSYNSSTRGVHYSSLVQLGAMVQAPVFQYIPWVNSVPILKGGTFRVGYDWIYVTDIGRSEKSVRYYSPLPKMEVNRTEQTLKGWFGGVGFTW